ncbi:hypothetical protein HMI54_013973 [Coelomomyces lativittatus]|nr:hypothetical protein HMI54_013973 [Coelomomyces lativittatus]KAJ1500228.1 hypothetical protein HMI55_003986 [Coelomomyces lativittatus]
MDFMSWDKTRSVMDFYCPPPKMTQNSTSSRTGIECTSQMDIPVANSYSYMTLPPTPQSFDMRKSFNKMNPTLDAANAIRSYDSNFQLTPNTSLENDTPVQAPVISDLQKDYSFMMNIPAFDPPPQALFRDAFTHPSKTMYAPLIEKGYKGR